MFVIHPRIRILVVLVLSFVISGVLMKYSQESPVDGTPSIQVQNIASDFSRSISDSGTSVLSALQSIRIPTLISLTPNTSNEPIDTVSPEPTPDEWVNEPTSPPEVPTSTPAFLNPAEPTVPPLISQAPPSNPTVRPSTPPQPTKVPKPTKAPKPTPTPQMPPVTEDRRPGDSLEEIMREVEKRVCVPYKLMMAIKTVETGERFKNADKKTIDLYNTYGWWKTADLQTTCFGYGYYTQTGVAAADSPVAGQKCMSAIGLQSYDLKIMGLTQASEQEEQVTRKNTIKTLPKNIDRRVFFDNLVIFAYATKARAGKFPQPSCTDWPAETVKEVARIHASGSGGKCTYTYSQNGKSGNYCEEIWNLYKSFK